jgi:GPH family glycoside/pentoside/hexuronide:cation symporter
MWEGGGRKMTRDDFLPEFRRPHAPQVGTALMMHTPASTPLPRRTKLIFGLGDWGPATTGTAFMFFFAFFLTDVARLDPAYAGLVLLIGGVWDAINDPLVGLLADRVHTRWGRRRPFFLFGALPYALTCILLWWTPPWSADLPRAIYFAVAYLLFDTVATLVGVPYTALTPELTEDYDERTRLNGYRMVVSMAGGLIAAIAVPLFADLFPERKTGYLLMAAVLGTLGALPYLLLFFGIRERFADIQTQRAFGNPLGLIASFRQTFANRPFRYAAGIYLTAWVTVSLVAALFQYYLTYWMHIADQIEIVLGLVQGAALLCVPAVVWLAGRWGKQRAYIVGVAWWALVMLSLAFLPSADRTAVYLLPLLAGLGIAAAHVIPWSIIPDVIEADELATGQRREGIYYGFLVCLQKGGAGLALAFMQWVLRLTGYVAGAEQAEGVLWAIRLLMGPFPALLLIASIVLAWRYPLTRARHAELRAQVAEQRRLARPESRSPQSEFRNP